MELENVDRITLRKALAKAAVYEISDQIDFYIKTMQIPDDIQLIFRDELQQKIQILLSDYVVKKRNK